jgi:hypothetical protein
MTTICFGQQPCGFFPKRFLVSKINTARALQKELGGNIVFFYHDSDADYRETITVMRDNFTNAEARLNFTQENKLQKKHSPLYLKRIPAGWKEEILKQLPRFVDKNLIGLFDSANGSNVADFCLDMYRKMRLLDGIEIARSGDPKFREAALDLAGEFFADVEYQGEVVRALIQDTRKDADSDAERRGNVPRESAINSATFRATLHEGGGKYTQVPMPEKIEKRQKNPGRDQRFAWMQSVIHCTHYIYGDGEKEYLDTKPFSDIKFIDREKIDQPGYAWLG